MGKGMYKYQKIYNKIYQILPIINRSKNKNKKIIKCNKILNKMLTFSKNRKQNKK